MALSVGLGRIANDPEATIMTRKALGKLATPGLLVTDQGLTINNDGRIVLRISSGLQEDTSGLSVKVKSGGGIVSGDDGLALGDVPIGDLTVENLTVNQNASIAGDVNVIGAVTTPVINSGTITNSGDIVSGSATIIENASVGGTFTTVNATISGNSTIGGDSSVGGTLTTTTLAVLGNAGVGGNLGAASISANSASISSNASVGGTLTAGTFSSSSISTGTITASGHVTAPTATVGATQLTALGIITGNIQANNVVSLGNLNSATQVVTGVSQVGSLNCTGNANVAAFACNSIDINGGTTLTKILSYAGTLAFPYVAGGFQIVSVNVTLSGALYSDALICSPIPFSGGGGFGSWSCGMVSDGNAVVRVVISSTAIGTVYVAFRFTAFRFV